MRTAQPAAKMKDISIIFPIYNLVGMQMKGGVIDQDDMCSLENDLAEVCILTLLNVWLNISMFVRHSINLYHYDCVYMIRTNVAGRYETREDQMNFHFELFDKIYGNPEPGRHFRKV